MEKKKETRGAKKGREITWNTRPAGVTKNKYMFGYRVSEQEHKELSYILQEVKKKKNLKSIDLIKKVFYDLAESENIDYKNIEGE